MKWTLKAQADGRLRPEDKESIMMLAASCGDMWERVRAVYELAGR